MDTANRPAARTFRDLIVWRKAHGFVLEVYKLSGTFPKQETYGLTSQLRRAAVSVAANIAEGFKRRGRADKVRFLNTAQGSLEECQYCLILAGDLGYGDTAEVAQTLNEEGRILDAYSASIIKRTPA